MTYRNVDHMLVDALPELKKPHARCIGEIEHPGQYIVFEDMFAHYIEVLLALPSSPARDERLRRAFAFVDLMAQCSDRNVRDLAMIAMYEGRSDWWFARARAFIGPQSQAFLDMYHSDWRQGAQVQANPDPERDIIDLYGVRDVIFHELRHEGVDLSAIPGISNPRE